MQCSMTIVALSVFGAKKKYFTNVYLFTMSGSLGELMTRENLIAGEWHQKLHTYGHIGQNYF